MGDQMKGVLMVTTTAVVWGATGSIVKLMQAEGVSQILVVALRGPFIALVVGLALLVARGSRALVVPRGVAARYAVLGTMSVAMMANGYLMSCMYLSVPQAVILHYTSPLLTMIGDCVITRERPTLPQCVAAVLIIVGLYVAFFWGSGIGDVDPMGVLWGCVSTVGFAGQNLISRVMNHGARRNDPIVQLFYSNLFGGIIILIFNTAMGMWAGIGLPSMRGALLMTYPIFVNGLLGFALLFLASRYIPATLSSVLCSIEVVSTIGMMPILLGTMPSLREACGAGIVLFAVVISTVFRRHA